MRSSSASSRRVGGRAILMASRAPGRAARSADDYLELYGGLIRPGAGAR